MDLEQFCMEKELKMYEHQRVILFAALVNTFPEQSWKTRKNTDGTEVCEGARFLVGIHTDDGPCTYQYENEYWPLFHCEELDKAPELDDHTNADVERLLSLEKKTEGDMGSWARREIELAVQSEKESAEGTDDWEYGVGVYNSAWRAYKSLLRDDHSGLSIQMTKSVLNRLIDGKCLTPIEERDDIWNEVEVRKDGRKVQQCKRMSGLFKETAADGTVTYSDIDRARVYEIHSPNVGFSSGLARALVDKLFPITLPYLPSSTPFKIYSEEWLTDPKNGDYDTIGYLDILMPDGKRLPLNRYFKEENGEMVRIDEAEFLERKERAKAREKGRKRT